jgi:TldD protein
MIKQDLSKYLVDCSNYTELRLQKNYNLSIGMVDGNVVRNDQREESGVSARVRHKGMWGFASSTIITDEEIRDVLRLADENAKVLGEKRNQTADDFSAFSDSVERDLSTTKPRKTQQELMDFLSEIDAHIVSEYPKLKSRTIFLSTLDMEKNVYTSQGASAYTLTPRAIVYILMQLEKDGEITEVSEVFGAPSNFEDYFSKAEDLYPKLAALYKHLEAKADGVFPRAGVFDVILDADLAGILAHEAIGHTTEGDLVIGGSVAGDYVGKKVASELVTLVDYAHTALGEICPVPIFIDDEGVTAQDVTIIEDGILKNFMHSRDTAQKLNGQALGNGRAYNFNDEPLVRMRNTAIVPGSSKLEDMIASVEDGYYLIQPSNGQADTTSEFMFGVTLGYEIKNGKLGRAIKDTTISGVAFDVLQSITMISDDMSWSCAGMCGKKQPIPVGMGGPAIKCKINIGGR